jgi:cytochrome P450
MDLIIEAQSFITAGTDTTAVTLTYLIWAVCQDETVRGRLVQELQALPADFKYADIRALPYLNAIIDEALRCYGAAPGSLPRVVPAAGANLAGYFIAGGVVVSTQAYSLHRDPSIFPDPEKYVQFSHRPTEY